MKLVILATGYPEMRRRKPDEDESRLPVCGAGRRRARLAQVILGYSLKEPPPFSQMLAPHARCAQETALYVAELKPSADIDRITQCPELTIGVASPLGHFLQSKSDLIDEPHSKILAADSRNVLGRATGVALERIRAEVAKKGKGDILAVCHHVLAADISYRLLATHAHDQTPDIDKVLSRNLNQCQGYQLEVEFGPKSSRVQLISEILPG